MAEYLLTGTRPNDGARETVNVEAESADEAVARLRARGHGEVVLHTDDVMARSTQQCQVSGVFSPAEYVAIRDRRGYLDDTRFALGKLYAREWPFTLMIVGVLAARRLIEGPLGLLDWCLLAVLAGPAAFVLLAQPSNPAYRYNRVVLATAWGRWEEVLRLLPGVEGRMAPDDAAFNRATALAGLGRLAEALEVVAPFAGGAGGVPEWLYLGRLGDVYFAAGEHELKFATMEACAAAAPDNPIALIDHARAVLRYRRDPARARELLGRAKAHALSDVMAPFAVATEGAILLEENRPTEARVKLAEALDGLERFRHATPLFGASADYMRANLAIACVALGDSGAAEDYAAAARPRLKALRDDDMAERVEAALAGRVRPARLQ